MTTRCYRAGCELSGVTVRLRLKVRRVAQKPGNNHGRVPGQAHHCANMTKKSGMKGHPIECTV